MATSILSGRPLRSSSGSGSGRDTRRAANWLGTAGWTAKGIVYLLIGLIALQIAFGDGGEQASKQGALRALAEQPAGAFLLGLVAFGLFAYAAYRLVTIGLDDAEGTERLRHVAARVGSAIAYTLAGVQAVAILLSSGSTDDGGNAAPKMWSARLLDSAVGTVVLLAAALGILAFAGYQLYQGFTKKFMDHLDCPAGSVSSETTVVLLGITGIVARGIVAGLVGVFLLQAVISHDPNQAEGLDGSLRQLQQASMGPLLLALVAAGLAAYGLFCLFSARFRRHADS
jgi:hypothetical protein